VLVGAPTAMGVLEAEYNNDLDCEAGAELAVKAVKAAVARDAVSGDGYLCFSPCLDCAS